MKHDLDRMADDIKKRMVDTGDDMQNQLFRLARAGEPRASKSVKQRIWQVIRDERMVVSGLSPEQLVLKMFQRNWGLGPIQEIYDDSDVNEVWVNGPGEGNVWIETNGKRVRSDISFGTADAIREVQQRLLSMENQELNQTHPMVEAKTLDGSRVTLTCPPETTQRTITLRKHNTIALTTEDYIALKTLDQQTANLLQTLVEGRANLLLIGSTSSGKTSLLKWLSQFIPHNLRIGVLEGTYELALDQFLPNHNVISFEEQPGLGRSLLKQFHTMLRQSPDIIILGEARGAEADQMVKTFRRGHPGSLSTIHSNSPEAAIQDLSDMVMEDGRNWDQQALYLRVARSIDVIVQMHLETETGIRRLWRVTEVDCPELSERVSFHDIVTFQPSTGTWHCSPETVSSDFEEKLRLQGISLSEGEVIL
ncbi:MAG TPA: ATPase, T2SS/T4P/T4SS family [Bacillales bacterium]